jgi:hypothetical protein
MWSWARLRPVVLDTSIILARNGPLQWLEGWPAGESDRYIDHRLG